MRNLIYVFFLVCFAVNGQTKMTLAQKQELKLIVKANADETKTISSLFTQTKHLDILDNDVVSNGKLVFKAPDLIKWEYLSPKKYGVIIKDQTLYVNENGKKNKIALSKNKMFKELNKLIVNSISGNMFDEDEFTINYFTTSANSWVDFAPKDKKISRFIKTFRITFNKKGVVTTVRMIEPSEDYTEIVFKNRITNNPIPDSVFIQ